MRNPIEGKQTEITIQGKFQKDFHLNAYTVWSNLQTDIDKTISQNSLSFGCERLTFKQEPSYIMIRQLHTI